MFSINFGKYIKEKRISMDITQAKAAQMYGISLSYLSGIERGLRPAPAIDVVKRIGDALGLNKQEKTELYDLAAESKKAPTLADDLLEYIFKYPVIRETLRYSMDSNMNEQDWERVFDMIKKKSF